MSKQKILKDPVMFSMLMESEQKNRVNRSRWHQSKEEGRNISLTEFMRRIIDIHCPPENSQMKLM